LKNLIKSKNKGFTLIEILIAVAILSLILISIFSGVAASINSISQSKNLTKAMLIAKTEMNSFIVKNMRGSDINNKKAENYENFIFSRKTEKVEHPLFGPLNAKKTEIIVRWKQKKRIHKYSLFYVYPTR